MKRSVALFLILALLLWGCGTDTPQPGETQAPTTIPTSGNASAVDVVEKDGLFTDRDLAGTYDEDESTSIELNGSTAACRSNAVVIDGSTITITDEGTYILSGTLDDGMVIVDVDKSSKVQLVLNGASITSSTSAPIYVLQADKVFLTTAPGSENALANGGVFESIDENNIDSVIFSKEDLTLNGSGSLTIESPAGHGIVSKDELTITSGTYTITTASHGITGKDNVCISGGSFSIAAGKDGIQADNDEDAALGFAYIAGGTFSISAEGDGISATGAFQIDGGSFDIITGGGSANGQNQTSGNWGGGPGGWGGGPGGPGGMGGEGSGDTTSTTEDSTSIKGLKADADLVINGGSFTMDCADDAIHSNTNVTITGGTYNIATGDDAFHAEETLAVLAGSITVTESYEGFEGLHIRVSGGDIHLVTTDDGLNAAGGTDQSGMGGRDQFGGGFGGGFGGNSDGSIVISGGDLFVNASGDGIDANGYLEITGGYTVVVGPTMGDTATLDYDTSAVISGGTFIGTGASGMAQTFSGSENQGVIAVQVGSAPAGTEIILTDTEGNTVLSCTPELGFNVVILSSPDIHKGESYTIHLGDAEGTFEAS